MAYTNEALGKALEDLTRAYDNFIKNAKDQIVQSLGTEVVNEIKQGANAYVSAQIDEKIETKVSAAMTGEEAAFFEKVDTKISTASQKLNTKISDVSEERKKDVFERFVNYYKNGYIQWPGMPSPLEDTSLHFEGYSWYEVNYDGNFFRAKGRNANPFSSKRFTIEQIKNGTYVFEADEQRDAIRNITGKLYGSHNKGAGFSRDNNPWGNNLFSADAYSGKAPLTTEEFLDSNIVYFNAGNVVPTAEENRSRNLTFTIWALVKDE